MVMQKDETLTVQVQDEALQRVVDRKVEERLRQMLPDTFLSQLRASNERGEPLHLDNDRRLAFAHQIWRNNGWMDRHRDPQKYPREIWDQKRYSVHDLIKAIDKSARVAKDHINSSGMKLEDYAMPTDSTILLPQVVSTVVREAVEPALVLTSLMRRISFSAGEQITFPAIGGITAEDMAPGQEYPERQIEMAGVVSAKIGKVGVAVRFTDEMLRYSMFDVMTLLLQAAGRAMARHKEQKVADLISSNGTVIYDNDTPASSLRSYTTGRDSNQQGNGTLTLVDLFQMFADLMQAGFIPNTLLMNPMGWLIFAQNETLRSFGFMNGGPLWGAINGAPGQAPTFASGGVNMHQGGGAAASVSPTEMANATLWSPVPQQFPAPLSIVVSPFITFDSDTQATDIIMCDRNELGILVEDEPLVTESWDEPARDMTKTKFRERYGLAIDNGGDAVAQAKGVRIARGYDYEHFVVEQTLAATGLPPLTGV